MSNEAFVIRGRKRLRGDIRVSGNKNAALPLLACTLLTDSDVDLTNVPDIADVRVLIEMLEQHGVECSKIAPEHWRFSAKRVTSADVASDLGARIRASFLFAGPLLARCGYVALPAPGGDQIGRRPLDTHMRAFEKLGAEVKREGGTYLLTALGGLKGADIFLEEMSVLATENVVMAAALATGETTIRNAASEPHVQDLCKCLVQMGASIEGIGTNTLHIHGKRALGGTQYEIGPDYVEAGSLLALGALLGDPMRLTHVRPAELEVVRIAFGRLGVKWIADDDSIVVSSDQELAAERGNSGAMCRIHDAPWPGFPADLTSIAVVLATQVRGSVLVHEWMYESRLFWVDKLIAMGANIVLCDPHRVIVEGPAMLHGTRVSSPDIRAGMSLLIAGLLAKGESVIQNASQIDRGYANIEQRLTSLGADIRRAEQ